MTNRLWDESTISEGGVLDRDRFSTRYGFVTFTGFTKETRKCNKNCKCNNTLLHLRLLLQNCKPVNVIKVGKCNNFYNYGPYYNYGFYTCACKNFENLINAKKVIDIYDYEYTLTALVGYNKLV